MDRPRLLDRVRAEIRARHYSRRTEEAYVHWIRRYILFHGKRHPSELSAAHVTAVLTSLATSASVASVAASTQNQAFSAVLFLYRQVLRQDLGGIEHAPRAKSPARVPVVLSVDEVRHLLAHLSGTPWLVASRLYGAGLRLQECLELRVKVSEGGLERVPEQIARERGLDRECVVGQIGASFFWASRANVPLSRVDAGAFVTLVATNGSGYVRIVKPEAKAAAALMSPTEERFDYVEHLVIGLRSVTYYGRRQ